MTKMAKKIRDWFAAGDDEVMTGDVTKQAVAVLIMLVLVLVAGGW